VHHELYGQRIGIVVFCVMTLHAQQKHIPPASVLLSPTCSLVLNINNAGQGVEPAALEAFMAAEHEHAGAHRREQRRSRWGHARFQLYAGKTSQAHHFVDRLAAAVPEHMRQHAPHTAGWGAAHFSSSLRGNRPGAAKRFKRPLATDPRFKVVDVDELLDVLLDGLRVPARGAAGGGERGQGHGGKGAAMARQRQLLKPQHLCQP
jgi:hypothetical protein